MYGSPKMVCPQAIAELTYYHHLHPALIHSAGTTPHKTCRTSIFHFQKLWLSSYSISNLRYDSELRPLFHFMSLFLAPSLHLFNSDLQAGLSRHLHSTLLAIYQNTLSHLLALSLRTQNSQSWTSRSLNYFLLL